MKKRTLLLALSLTVVMAMAGCGKKEEAPEEPTTVETVDLSGQEEATTEAAEEESDEIPEGMVRSDLTNELIDESIANQRPIAAMDDNESIALPYFDTAEEDVVYVIQ